MKRTGKYLLHWICSIWLIFTVNQSLGQFSKETGFFPIKNFTPEDYNNALPKNSAIIQDHRGVMYFGNDEGVLEYDGIRWKLYPLSKGGPVHSLAIDLNGRIYVGSVDEFGYLSPGPHGELKYISLSENLNDSINESYTVWHIHCINNDVFFQTNGYIFRWNGMDFYTWKAKTKFHTSFVVNDKVIVKQLNDGLFCLNGDELIDISGDDVFIDKSIFSIIPFENSSYFVVTQKHGFYSVEFNGAFTNITAEAISQETLNFIGNFDLINAIRISKNTFSVGTWGSGLLIYQNGKIVQIITRKSGLRDEVINYQYLDKDNNLWLALSEGITKIEINSPLTRFTQELGVDGSIQSIARFNNFLYIATEKGLLQLLSHEWVDPSKIYDQNKFVKVKTFLGGLWDLHEFKNGTDNLLLLATESNVLQMDSKNSYSKIYNCYPWRIYQSLVNPNRIFIGHEDGLTSLIKVKGGWITEYEFPEINEKVFSICEDSSNNIWLGTKGQGVIKIQLSSKDNFSDLQIKKYSSTRGLPENSDIVVTFFDGQILIGTNKGLYQFIEGKDSIAVSNQFSEELANPDRIITRFKKQDENNLWITTFIASERRIDVGLVQKDEKGYKWIDTPFNTISKGDLYSVYCDDDGMVWFGGSEGIYRYDPTVNKNYQRDFASLIRLNIIGQDSTIFFGTYFDEKGYVTTVQPSVLKPKLKYRYNSLHFDFSAQNTEIDHPVLFSYILDGYNDTWSEWSEDSERYYTNLREGNYTFKVKARNIFEHESEIAQYEFSISPPWYRTIVAFILYVLILIGSVILIVKEYTKYLRAIIREKTKEIREQKEIVEHKNEEITSSIKYAQRIQTALLPPAEILEEAKIEHFILFKPRDIVSGDFYWFRTIGDFTIIVAADCTGHGVPGAFVSMLGMAFLNEISVTLKDVKANDILNSLRALVIKSLRQSGKQGESKDGMDIALYVIDRKNMKLQYAGANNPLILIRKKEIIQVKADRMPIGYHLVMDEFQNNEMEILTGDMLYTFSDGYQDQFGGENSSKFMIKKLKELMVQVSDKTVEEQKNIFDETIENWKGKTHEQIDDILLIGVRI